MLTPQSWRRNIDIKWMFSWFVGTFRLYGIIGTCIVWRYLKSISGWVNFTSRCKSLAHAIADDTWSPACQILHRREGGTPFDHRYRRKSRSVKLSMGIVKNFHGSSPHRFWRVLRYHGGWLAPSIYFLGHAGCVQVNGVRIAGASGIFNANHFRQGESCALVRWTIQFLISFVCDRTLGDNALR